MNMNQKAAERTNLTLSMYLRFLMLFSLLSVFGWPNMLHAEQFVQIQSALPSSSFLLVASQHLADPRFSKSVILVTKHGNSGPIGVIINRPLDIPLQNLFPSYPVAGDMKLFDGGPVFPDQISYLVRGEDTAIGTLTVTGNIYLAYDSSLLNELLSGKRRYTGLRVMHGLASWAPGQLEYEISRGDWYVKPLDEAVLFDRLPDDLWQELQSHAALM